MLDISIHITLGLAIWAACYGLFRIIETTHPPTESWLLAFFINLGLWPGREIAQNGVDWSARVTAEAFAAVWAMGIILVLMLAIGKWRL